VPYGEGLEKWRELGVSQGQGSSHVAAVPLVLTRLQVNKGERDAHCAAREARLPPAAACSSHSSRRFTKRLGLMSPLSSRRRTMWRPSSSSSNSEPSSSSFPEYRRRSLVASASSHAHVQPNSQTGFAPQTRKEISSIAWHWVSDLPSSGSGLRAPECACGTDACASTGALTVGRVS